MHATKLPSTLEERERDKKYTIVSAAAAPVRFCSPLTLSDPTFSAVRQEEKLLGAIASGVTLLSFFAVCFHGWQMDVPCEPHGDPV